MLGNVLFVVGAVSACALLAWLFQRAEDRQQRPHNVQPHTQFKPSRHHF